MTRYKNLVIEPLNSSHNRPGFHCGVDSLDGYIRRQAKQDVKRHVSRVFVATELTEPNVIIGYYSLSSLAVELSHLPDSMIRKLPKHPMPAALIGRLAVSKKAQGYGVGKMLLANAIKRTLSVRNEIVIYAMVVDAIDSEAENFYKQFGFMLLDAKTRRLFLPLDSISL
jgi:predicted GNAT family N-acyltransferase